MILVGVPACQVLDFECRMPARTSQLFMLGDHRRRELRKAVATRNHKIGCMLSSNPMPTWRNQPACFSAALRLQVCRWMIGLLLTACQTLPAEEEQFSTEQIAFFESKIRPMLVEHCYECHSGHSKSVEAGLQVDSRPSLLMGGDSGPAIDLQKPQESLLLSAINHGDLVQMPPNSKLPQDAIDLFAQWLGMGAPWPAETHNQPDRTAKFDLAKRRSEHWCWQAPCVVAPPTVADPRWSRNSIDAFLFDRLNAKGLKPNPPASREALIRRAYFDLIGLPPTPEQAADYFSDTCENAFEKVIDGLLDSPHFGEHWARHWMDLMRFAETCGHEFDFPIRDAYRYRDYLIRALNADVPYDQFITEHIAGDLLDQPRLHPIDQTNESILATGFWFLGEAVHAPVDVKGDSSARIDNQIDILTKTFLGLTVACARCHDHKFDAISSEDYYALSGFLQSSRRQEVMLDPHHQIASKTQDISKLVGEADHVAKQLQQSFQKTDPRQLARLFASMIEMAEDREKDPSSETTETELPVGHPLYALQQVGRELSRNPNGGYDAAKEIVKERIRIQAAEAEKTRTSARKFADFGADNFGQWFETGFGFGGDGVAAGKADTSGETLLIPNDVAHSGRLGARQFGVLRSPTFTIEHSKVHYRMQGEKAQIRLIIDGFVMDVFNPLLFADMSFTFDSPDNFAWRTQAGDLKKYLGHRAYIEIIDHGDGFAAVDEIWFSDGEAPADLPNPLAEHALDQSRSIDDLCLTLATAIVGEVNSRDQAETINWLAGNATGQGCDQELIARLKVLKDQIRSLQADLPFPQMALGMTDGTGENGTIFIRGNHRNRGAEVPRDMIAALNRTPDVTFDPQHGSGRLYLAERIVDPSNPLTARVMVNRVWHHLFGRGLVGSVDNFGVLGEMPTHPELLDCLAVEFSSSGWSTKALIKRIVTSQVYQLSSAINAAQEEVDPKNELYYRFPIKRLQGEAIRDAMLMISGDLDPTQFGPSVTVHLTSFMEGRGRPGVSGPLNGAGRRSIYTEVRRNFLSPMMLAFDTPIPFNSMGRRSVSNVPAQALILMNSPFVADQARKWAARLIHSEPELRNRIDRAYRQAFARSPSTMEVEQGTEFLNQQAKEMQLEPTEIDENQDIWADYCHVLLNVKEFIYLR